MLKVPRFKHHHHVEIVPPDKIFFLSESGYQVLSARSAVAVAELIDGTRTSDQIVDLLADRVPRTQAYYALAVMESKRYIEEVGEQETEGDEPGLAFWSSFGVDGATAVERIAAARVALRSFGEVVSEPFVAALAALGIRVGEEPADLTVVLTDDYLRGELDEINRRALAEGTPWMLVKPNGLYAWLGPIFEPSRTGCWQCLRQRLLANREIDSFLREVGRQDATFAARPFLPSTIASALNLAATEVAKWLITGSNERLHGRIVAIDLSALATSDHVLVRRPQCPTCGDPGLQAQIPLKLPLESRPKTYVDDGAHRAVSAQETLLKVDHHVSPLTGVVSRLLRITPEEDRLSHVYISGANMAVRSPTYDLLRSTLRSRTAGKGLSDVQAKVSAIGEAIERYSGTFRGDEARRRASYRELGESAVDPRGCMLFSERQYAEREDWLAKESPFMRVPLPFDEETAIEWSPVWSLTHDTIRYLPTELCYYSYPIASEHHFCLPDSNGCSAGNSFEEAIVQGFLELVERDAVCQWWYNRLGRPHLDLGSFDDPYALSLQRRHRSIHRDLWVLDLTNDLGVPAFVAVSRRTDKAREDIVFAPAAHFDPLVALHRALTELNQLATAVGDVTPDGEEYAFDDEHSVNWWKTATLDNQPYLRPSDAEPPRTRADFDYRASEDLLDDVHLCRHLVESRGLEMLVLNQSRPDIELPVVKVIVPGLRHFWARFAPGRLYDVPVEMGWLGSPLAEEDLNPIPIFI